MAKRAFAAREFSLRSSSHILRLVFPRQRFLPTIRRSARMTSTHASNTRLFLVGKNKSHYRPKVMRFKLDENLPGTLATDLKALGIDAATCQDEGIGGAGDSA